jgi:D-alanyl-lipoteichoic acid biosynthesis protein DltD
MRRLPHSIAGILALAAASAAVLAFLLYARLFEEKYVHAVAGVDHSRLNTGSELERIALRQDDLLLIYGASELVLLDTHYQANRFFSDYPTGFMVFNVAAKGGSALTIAQKFAGLGDDLRGRRLVLALGPAIMTMAPYGEVNTRHYDANFSPLNALELAYSPDLSLAVKRRAAARMLEFPGSLEDRPFIRFSLEHLAGDSVLDRTLYCLSWPLGRLQITLLRLQDHYATVNFIRHLSAEQVSITRQRREIDWESLVAIAEEEQIRNTDSNPYRVDNSQWPKIKELFAAPRTPGTRDQEFIADVDTAREWDDIEIALEIIRQLEGEAIVMSTPMNVPLWEVIGVSEAAQNAYYEKLHSVVEPYGLPVVDFSDYGRVSYFSMDLASHTSRKGWIYVNQTLDAIYHGDLP